MITNKIILAALLITFFLPGFTVAQKGIEKTTRVNIRIIEQDSRQITPAMVCITGVKDSKVRIPPDAVIPDSPSHTKAFYSGVEYKKDKNWVGPVRKMNGLGDNDDRSYVYELVPSIPYWKEPVMYQTSGDFSIDLPPCPKGNYLPPLNYYPVSTYIYSSKIFFLFSLNHNHTK